MADSFLNGRNQSLFKEASENPLMLAQQKKGAEFSLEEKDNETLEIIH